MPARFPNAVFAASLVALAVSGAGQAVAQSTSSTTTSAPDGAATGDEITVTGWRLRKLDVDVATGSRLGLSVRETPATIDQITAGEILTRGFRTVEEATDSLPGIISGGSPGDPALFSMRGFSGDEVTVLHNGLYLGPGDMIKLVTGARGERLFLTRENYNADGRFNSGTSFKRTYKLFNWRAGLVYDVLPGMTAYFSYSTGQDPVNSNIFLVNAGENFSMSKARQFEAGIKADLMGGRGSLTLSAYDIILAELVPDRATEILARGRAYGDSRYICGAHNLSAVEAGRLAAASIVARLHGDSGFRRDLDAARREMDGLPSTIHAQN